MDYGLSGGGAFRFGGREIKTKPSMDRESVDLVALQKRLKQGIERACPEKLWLRAEISAVKARSGGHCYLELSQNDSSGLVAKATAIIWANNYRFLAYRFLRATGSELEPGMKILAFVQVNYSPLYGLSLIISDIDESYTIGEKELLRQQTISRLKAEGLMDAQKELAISVLPRRIAVVSAPNAAGYGDFCRHLAENEYGFKFYTELFPALMQGETCPNSIAEALGKASQGRFDAILIMRGGGGKIELSCYDDYGLAVAIATCPLPVFTAVGHDEDYHVCDMVAYDYAKTPTALADVFIGFFESEDERISSYVSRLAVALSGRFHAAQARLDSLGRRTVDLAKARISAALMRGENLDRRVKDLARARLSEAALRVESRRSRIMDLVRARLTAGLSRVDFIEMKIRMADPWAVLSRGFSLAMDAEGRKMMSVSGCKIGDTVSVAFPDGSIGCTVKEITTGPIE